MSVSFNVCDIDVLALTELLMVPVIANAHCTKNEVFH